MCQHTDLSGPGNLLHQMVRPLTGLPTVSSTTITPELTLPGPPPVWLLPLLSDTCFAKMCFHFCHPEQPLLLKIKTSDTTLSGRGKVTNTIETCTNFTVSFLSILWSYNGFS